MPHTLFLVRLALGLTAQVPMPTGIVCANSEALAERIGNDVWDLQNLFGSEHPGKLGDPPRRFMQLNDCEPGVLFDDLTKRTSEGGVCRRRRRRVKVPMAKVYGAGTVCRDWSNANSGRRQHTKLPVTEQSGQSSKTLKASLTYIFKREPPLVFLENVYRKPVLLWVLKQFNDSGLYRAIGFVLDPKTLKLGVSGKK